MSTAHKGDRVTHGLVLLARRVPPGTRVTMDEMAAWAGCTKSSICYLEQRALRKIRFRARAALRELASAYALPFTP